MCHTIDFRKRLTIDYPTISLADWALEKLQIVKINEKDIKDLMILFLEHDVGDGDKETVNADYISKILSKDWGFYYTVTTNLTKVKAFLPEYSILTKENVKEIETQINKLIDAIEKKSKSMGWKLRAKVETKKRWYVEIGED